jgi:hypothetical protein
MSSRAGGSGGRTRIEYRSGRIHKSDLYNTALPVHEKCLLSIPLNIDVLHRSSHSPPVKMYAKFATLAALVAAASAQQACSLTAETHPSMTWSKCSAGGSCTSVSGSVTIDANWRWLHQLNSATNCYTGNAWNITYCSTDATCAAQCCVDGSDYSGTYGATTSGNALNLKFVTQGSYSKNIGSRMYLMESDTKYQSRSTPPSTRSRT